jgi:hypothetical protein
LLPFGFGSHRQAFFKEKTFVFSKRVDRIQNLLDDRWTHGTPQKRTVGIANVDGILGL